MKITDLIIKLTDVYKQNPNANVYILEEDVGFYFDFSGFSVDDNNDITLDIVSGDKPA